jgi:hypothetical protein
VAPASLVHHADESSDPAIVFQQLGQRVVRTDDFLVVVI